jgi:hypothetical protein
MDMPYDVEPAGATAATAASAATTGGSAGGWAGGSAGGTIGASCAMDAAAKNATPNLNASFRMVLKDFMLFSSDKTTHSYCKGFCALLER